MPNIIGKSRLTGCQRKIRRSPSAAQFKRRNAYRQCVNFWRTQVTDQNRKAWCQYAARHKRISKTGRQYTMIGYCAFMGLNLYRAYNDVPLLSCPPESE